MQYKTVKAPWEVTQRFSGGQTVSVLVVRCACGASHEIIDRKHLPPKVIEQKFAQAEWRALVGSKKAICPKCSRRRKAPRSTQRKEPAVSKPTNGAAQNADTVRHPTMKDFREIVNALEMYFDAEAGLYKSGYSDDKIADELQVPRASVSKVRAEAFGDLKIDPELLKLQEQVIAAQNTCRSLSRQLATMQDKVTAATQTVGELEKMVAAKTANA